MRRPCLRSPGQRSSEEQPLERAQRAATGGAGSSVGAGQVAASGPISFIEVGCGAVATIRGGPSLPGPVRHAHGRFARATAPPRAGAAAGAAGRASSIQLLIRTFTPRAGRHCAPLQVQVPALAALAPLAPAHRAARKPRARRRARRAAGRRTDVRILQLLALQLRGRLPPQPRGHSRRAAAGQPAAQRAQQPRSGRRQPPPGMPRERHQGQPPRVFASWRRTGGLG